MKVYIYKNTTYANVERKMSISYHIVGVVDVSPNFHQTNFLVNSGWISKQKLGINFSSLQLDSRRHNDV